MSSSSVEVLDLVGCIFPGACLPIAVRRQPGLDCFGGLTELDIQEGSRPMWLAIDTLPFLQLLSLYGSIFLKTSFC